MRNVRFRLLAVICWTASVTTLGMAQTASPPSAPPPQFTSKPIMVSTLTGEDKREMVLLAVSIQPNAAVPMHTHPGDCVGSVVEGAVELLIEGQPPRRVAAGEAYSNARGTVHGFRNVGDVQAKLLNSLVVDKGSARVQPAAQPAKP